MKKAMVVLLAGMMTLGLAACGGENSDGGDAAESKNAETYKISYNLNSGNTTDMPKYQFLGGDISGMANYDARVYDDITLTLNDDGTYELTSDMYTMSNGERIEIGASDGVGIVCIVNAEGTYEDNEDGTVTTSAAEHVNFELETDVYTEETVKSFHLAAVEGEMKGTYDSDDVPALLDWVPETVFTLGEDGDIVTYANADGTTADGAAADDTAADSTAE